MPAAPDEKTRLTNNSNMQDDSNNNNDDDDDGDEDNRLSLYPQLLTEHLMERVGERGSTCLKATFLVLVAFAVVVNLFIGVVQFLPLVYHPIYLQKNDGPKPSFWEVVERIYITMICLGMLLAEIRLPIAFFRSMVLQSFICRGFLYAFIGNLCLVQSNAEEMRQFILHHGKFFTSWNSILLTVAGYMGYTIGGIYLGLGIFCFRHIFEHVHTSGSEATAQKRKTLERTSTNTRDAAEEL